MYKPQLLCGFSGGFVIGYMVSNMFINYYNVIIPRDVFDLNIKYYRSKINDLTRKLTKLLENKTDLIEDKTEKDK